MSVDLTQFHASFFDEVDEHVAVIEGLLLSPEAQASGREQLDAIFRAAHSIKGGSGTFGFIQLQTLTHRMESLFDAVRHEQMPMTDEVIDVVLRALDRVRDLVEAYREGRPVEQGFEDEAVSELESLLGSEESTRSASSAPPKPKRKFAIEYLCVHETEAKKQGEIYDSLLSTLMPLGEFTDLNLNTAFVATFETIMEESELRDVFAFVTGEGDVLTVADATPQVKEPLPAPSPATNGQVEHRGTSTGAPRPDESIRVSLAKVDALINLVGEIVTAENILAGTVRGYDPTTDAALFDAAQKIARHTRDMRQIVMSIRMLPISFIFGRFPRVVRETAQKLGKEVELKLVGEDTELDKGIIERLSDPLTHLVRNSIDHGIENPDVRVEQGKPAQGHLELRAAHVSGNILLEVIDDGAGLSRERIIAKARSNGIAIHDDAPDKDVWDLIFAPGFSTAAAVTEVSGRGVGMDVVRRNVGELGGSIEIDSTPGAGTRIAIHLPLTLAILDGLTVLVGKHVYVVPIANVVASLQPTAGAIKALPGGGEIIVFEGEPVRLCRLHRFFGISDAIQDPERGIIVIVRSGGRSAALLVDALDAQQQLVIKSLETNFRRTKGIAGASVIESGAIALILDTLAFVRADNTDHAKARPEEPNQQLVAH